jgi:initiation factor 1A
MPGKKKGANNTRMVSRKIPIEYASEGQHYAVVTAVLGNCHFKVRTFKNEDYTASLCGKVKKNGRVIMNDKVLIEPTGDALDCKFKIIHKYSADQVRQLSKEGLITVAADPTSKEFIAKKEEEASNGFIIATEEDEQKIAYQSMLTGKDTSNAKTSLRVYQEQDELENIKDTFGTDALDDI